MKIFSCPEFYFFALLNLAVVFYADRIDSEHALDFSSTSVMEKKQCNDFYLSFSDRRPAKHKTDDSGCLPKGDYNPGFNPLIPTKTPIAAYDAFSA